MFTLEDIKQAHSQVKSGADFPKYIQALKELGIISYEVSLRVGHVNYLGMDHFQITTTTGIDSLLINPVLDIKTFQSDLKNHQNGNTDYLIFCQDCAKSGIEKWIIDLCNMTCTYYDASGDEALVEVIPH